MTFGRLVSECGLCLHLHQEDVCLQGYLRHVSSITAPAPLTRAEQELQRIKTTEVRSLEF